MGSRRRGGKKNRARDRDTSVDAPLEQTTMPDLLPVATADPDAGLGTLAPIVVSNAFWVQFAVFEPCDVAGCTDQVAPEAWELLDLDTEEEPPARFCDDHQIAWVTRPRERTSTSGGLVSL